LLLIGRQIQTDYGKFIDMLALDQEGNLVIIELKKNRTPREVVAQTLDYASWVQNLSYERIQKYI
jgi:RecB family endonuclease NucS